MKKIYSSALVTLALAMLAASPISHAQQATKNDPAATLQAYLDAINSANLPALMALISDDLAPFKYATCTPQMNSKQCFIHFADTTILKRHGSLVSPSAKVEGDVIIAVIEVRHDATRAAGVPRLIGIDTITVKNNKITAFKFEQLPDDPHNKRLAAFNAANAPAVPAR